MVVPSVREHQRQFREAVESDTPDAEAVHHGSLLAVDYANAIARSGYVLRGDALDAYERIRNLYGTLQKMMAETRSISSGCDVINDESFILVKREQTMAMYRLLKAIDDESLEMRHGDVASPALFARNEPGDVPPSEMVVRLVLDDETKRWLENMLTGIAAQMTMMMKW